MSFRLSLRRKKKTRKKKQQRVKRMRRKNSGFPSVRARTKERSRVTGKHFWLSSFRTTFALQKLPTKSSRQRHCINTIFVLFHFLRLSQKKNETINKKSKKKKNISLIIASCAAAYLHIQFIFTYLRLHYFVSHSSLLFVFFFHSQSFRAVFAVTPLIPLCFFAILTVEIIL